MPPSEEDASQRLNQVIEEEPSLVEGDPPELDMAGAEAASPETRKNLKLPHGLLK